jgi:hypothetical protein
MIFMFAVESPRWDGMQAPANAKENPIFFRFGDIGEAQAPRFAGICANCIVKRRWSQTALSVWVCGK